MFVVVVAFGEVSQVASALTPVPGGVGPMTIAALIITHCKQPATMQALWHRDACIAMGFELSRIRLVSSALSS